jgi:Protein of unknown function (DUF3225)/Protein of unknown function (DUF4089)
MTLNDPALVAKLAALHDAYERALANNDVPVLTEFFWASPHVVRYGVAEELYGADAVRAYRQTHSPAFMAEIELTFADRPRLNRQSQTWVNLPELGWRIVAAHVSLPASSAAPTELEIWSEYAEHLASTVGLTLDPAHRPGVAANLARTAALAAPLLSFRLSDDAEPASVFTA